MMISCRKHSKITPTSDDTARKEYNGHRRTVCFDRDVQVKIGHSNRVHERGLDLQR